MRRGEERRKKEKFYLFTCKVESSNLCHNQTIVHDFWIKHGPLNVNRKVIKEYI